MSLDLAKKCSICPDICIHEVKERLFQRVEKTETCWIRHAGHNRGYTVIKIGRKSCRANRVAWEIFNGPIPQGMFVLHKCDNPPCIRPDHLYIGTPSENSSDMVKKERQARGEKNFKAKLTDNAVKYIRKRISFFPSRRHGREKFLNKLAKKFSVTPDTIRSVMFRKYWKHVKQ